MNRFIAECDDVSWAYDGRVLFEHLSTVFNPKTFTTILGPNGSGKTTLLKHLLNLLPLREDSVRLAGKDIMKYRQKQIAKIISYVPQKSSANYEFSVFDFVAMGRYSYIPRFSAMSSNDLEAVDSACLMAGVAHLRNRIITELSGGEFQRVVIARALAQQALIIALDEPVSHLDVRNQREILALLRSLVDQSEVAIVCVLHDLNAAAAYSDRIIMMQEGTIVADGTPEAVLTVDRIKDVYQVDVETYRNKESGRLALLPVWR